MSALIESYDTELAARINALQVEFDHVKFLQSVETDPVVVLNYGHELELLMESIHNAHGELWDEFYSDEPDYCNDEDDESESVQLVVVPTQDNLMYQRQMDILNALCDSYWNASRCEDVALADDLRQKAWEVESQIFAIMEKVTYLNW